MQPPNEVDYAAITGIDRFLHEPARLAIMAVLSACESADFHFLLTATNLNKGNLSAQAIKLDEIGYIQTEKGFHGRTAYTQFSITPAGKAALKNYREQLQKTLNSLS